MIHDRLPGAGILGPYRLARVIARGGMATVFEAQDERSGRSVAVKVLHAHLAEHGGAARFLREGRIVSSVVHPNVVSIVDVGEHKGTPYLVMEYLEGHDLAVELSARKRLPWHELAQLMLPVLGGVAAAHAARVVHRDLKPSNILLARGQSGEVTPKVVDFGISKIVGIGTGAADATASDVVMGTPSYMAPEQMRGAALADERSDQYSLGVILYVAATGRKPFEGDTIFEVVRSIMSAPVTPPSDIAGDLPPGFDDVVLRAMSRRPEDRYTDVNALATALDALRSGAECERRERSASASSRAPVANTITAFARGGAPKRSDAGGLWRLALASLVAVVVAAASLGAWARLRGAPHASAAASGALCEALPADATDFYVDQAATGPRRGTSACPFGSIADAVNAARASRAATKTVHVARGVYSARTGETFPIVLRGGVSLVGAGQEATVLEGLGPVPSDETPYADDPPPALAAIVVGDDAALTRIGDIGLRSGAAKSSMHDFGIYCDRGDPARGLTVLSAIATDVLDVGVVATATRSGPPSACRLQVLASTFRNAWTGIFARGECTAGVPAVGIDVGDGTPDGANRFTEMHDDAGDGAGVEVWDCVDHAWVRKNSFITSDQGVSIEQHDDRKSGKHPFEDIIIEGNRFEALRRAGVHLALDATVGRLENNSFSNIGYAATGPAAPGASAALLLDSGAWPTGFPRVLRARRNSFVGNRTGVLLDGEFGFADSAPSDFGTVDDPGGNVFACNSSRGDGVPGRDVVVRVPSRGVGALPFAGNGWDHAPPTIVGGKRADRAADGTDVVVAPRRLEARAAVLDLRSAIAREGPCPNGHARGP
jgi:serine/threonine-protein kinase